MLSVDLARQLLAAGMIWEPAPGDRFVVPDRGMDDEVFYISHMTIDVVPTPAGRLVGFNGVAEWALDSLMLDEVLWLPSEAQLRTFLGERFLSLTADGGWKVGVRLTSGVREFADDDVENAYALAVVAMLRA